MACSNDLAQVPQEEIITLEEILSSLVGKYVVIVLKEAVEEKQDTKQEEQTAKGVLYVTKHKLVIIGKEGYKPDTHVIGVLQIEDTENNASLCSICPFGCGGNPEYCIDIIGEIIGRKAQ